MKLTIFLTFVGHIVFVQGERSLSEIIGKFQKIKTECVKETNVNETVLRTLLEKQILADDEALHEYLFCFGKKYNYLSEKGEYLKDKIKEDFAEANLTDLGIEIAENCTTKDYGNGKENAVHLTKCYYESSIWKDTIKEKVDKFVQFKTDCIAETKVNESLVNTALDKGIIADDEALHNYILCWLKKVDFINEEGGYRKDKIFEHFIEGHGTQLGTLIAEACTIHDYGSAKANAIHLNKCYYEHMHM